MFDCAVRYGALVPLFLLFDQTSISRGEEKPRQPLLVGHFMGRFQEIARAN